MTQPAKAPEPSMEEILASIRRIIADDDAAKTPAKPSEPPTPAKAPEPPKAAAAAPARQAPAPPAAAGKAPVARPAPPPAPAPANGGANSQDDIDALFARMEAEEADSPPGQDAEEILELTEDMETGPNAAPAFRTIDARPDVIFDDPPPEPEPLPAAAPARQPRAGEDDERSWIRPQASEREHPLLSPTTAAAVDSAFNSLAQTVLVQNARTLEDLVREMLRPMLKGWLDDNLPQIVERLVRAEIERVSRGRG